MPFHSIDLKLFFEMVEKIKLEKFWSGPKFGCIQNNLDQSKIVLDFLKDKPFRSSLELNY